MAKTGKRILAVILLILTVLLVGWLWFTGNRLVSYPNIDVYKRVVFEGKDNTIVAFTDEGVWYGTGEEEVILLEIIDYSEGVITMKKNNKNLRFVAVDKDMIYDENTKQFLTRRASDDEFT